LASAAQEPPSVASVATPAKLSTMPTSKGKPLRTKGWSTLAKTKGTTGRMQGARMVSTPAK